MSDDVDVDPGLFSPAETPILLAAQITTTLFTDAFYPTQLEANPTLGLAGEQRGFYANNRWSPSASAFGLIRTTGLQHGGVDIFAPFGRAIIATVDGDAEMRPVDGDGLGNRVHLTFVAFGVQYRFLFGHFDRFEGASRSVSKGDVIGYAGCTGNAAGNQPCLAPNSCGKFSTHVHLELRRDADQKRMNPTLALGWTLKYSDDVSDKLCSDIVT